MSLKLLFTGHGYNATSASSFTAQINTTSLVFAPSTATTLTIFGVSTGRFANTAGATFAGLESTAQRTGSFYSQTYDLRTDKYVYIAMDIEFANTYTTDQTRYVCGLTNGNIYLSSGIAPLTAANNSSMYWTLIQGLGGTLELRSNDGNLLAAGTYPFSRETWYRLTIESKIDSSGEFKAYINDIIDINYTGDITSGISSNVYRLRFGGYNVFNSTLAVWDTEDTGNTGVGFNQYVPDFNPIQILPDGAGLSTQGTPVGNAINWQAVDETFRNGTTDYVLLNANTTQKDLYSYSNISVTGNVISVATLPAAWSTTTGNPKITFETSSNGVNANSSLSPMLGGIANTTFGAVNFVQEIPVDPNTGNAWTINAVNNAQFGVSAKT